MSLKRRAVISGMGLLCPIGDSPKALHCALRTGEPDGQANQASIAVRQLANEAPDCYLHGRNAYPLDRPARLLTAVAGLALADGGWSPDQLRREDVGLFVGTVFSSAATICRFDCQAVSEGPFYASPLDFANTVINAPSGQTAIWHALRGVNQTLATGVSSGLHAIGAAADAVGAGRTSVVLAGGVEELSVDAVRAFTAAGMLCTPDRPSRPFDADSGGLSLSEGAALLVVETRDTAEHRGDRAMAEVRGYGQAFDVSRRRDETRSVRAIVRSMRLALEQACLGPDEIDVVCAAANGVTSMDRHEALAIAAVFESRRRFPRICAVKSRLGEALGAGGPLQCVAMIEAMRTGILPAALDICHFRDTFVESLHEPELTREGIRTCIVNSLSYDGHSCSLVLTSCVA
jgi:3-oxoacyl-[acyl-carrier-protein] synthase II